MNSQPLGPLVFRITLFVAALSLALYIPYKFITTVYTFQSMYSVLFPLSSILALTGMLLAIKPKSYDCSVVSRVILIGLGILWMAKGLDCSMDLARMIVNSPISGIMATLQMLTQHVFLSLVIIIFAITPSWILNKLGVVQTNVPTAIDIETHATA